MIMVRNVVFVGVLALAGCSGDDAADAAPGAKSDGSGQAHGTDCVLPAEYAALPVVPGCFHVSDHRIAVQLSTTATRAEVRAFLESALPEQGWTIAATSTTQDGLLHLDLSGHGVDSAYIEIGARDSADDRAIPVTYYIN